VAQQGNAITVGNIEDEAIARRVSISDEIAVPEDSDLTARSGSGRRHRGTERRVSGPGR